MRTKPIVNINMWIVKFISGFLFNIAIELNEIKPTIISKSPII